MNWALAGQIVTVLIVWLLVAAFIAPYVGRWLRKRREQQRSVRCARLEKLVELADEFDAAPTDTERQAIYREAQSLDLTGKDESPPKYAIPVHVVPTEQQKELSQQNELEAEMIEYNTRPRDPALEVARIAFETGRTVIGNIDDKGKLSIDVLPERDAKWQDRARKAEGLGFIDPEDAA